MSEHKFSAFLAPTIATVLGLVAIWWWGGVHAFFVASLLVVLEVTLSFDNAVVNAKVLQHLSDKWQKRFLTWGIFISVVLTRAFLPIAIVAVSTATSFWAISQIAWNDPAQYAALLEDAHY